MRGVQMRITLLRSVSGAVPGVWSELESWVISDLLELIPPDRRGVLRGTMEFATRRPVYPGTKDDLVWTYAPRCGSVSTIEAFDATVLDE